ncbi:MAG: tRNA uridine-5-carboxymethylaminomethyl(34) synthesis GTPase MnmE [Defluviicoccus sp.]|nr:tRNA uridine-5-carboxymethylaminomethyl(34) synthesis GTPase MnmE [Defluviicoccus sp.]
MSSTTVFALSTARGRAAIAVFRVSGPAAGAALESLTGLADPAPRRAMRVAIREPATGEMLDDGLALWFPGPASYTGEDMAELHVHGGRAVVEAVGLALGRTDGLVPAGPGDFTRRAFAAGKLDLTQVEAIADLVDAETEAQRRQARRQAGGALAELYESWRGLLVGALAHLEAFIDFPDEDLPREAEAEIAETVARLARDVARHLGDARRGERLRDGVAVAVLGPPNVGKSSLVNALARREAAIVAAEAGTTRDAIEIHLDLGGLPATVIDTAGLREAAGAVEAEGIRRALARADDADLRLVMLDARAPEPDAALARLIDGDALVALNKTDLRATPPPGRVAGMQATALSVRTGDGLAALIARLTDAVAERTATGAAPVPTRLRHRLALDSCLAALQRAQGQDVPELRAEDLRAAAAALGRLTGRVGVEDVLDAIFRDFCIGK